MFEKVDISRRLLYSPVTEGAVIQKINVDNYVCILLIIRMVTIISMAIWGALDHRRILAGSR